MLPDRRSVIGRLLAPRAPVSLDALSANDRALAFALADLRALADSHPGELTIGTDRIQISHRIAAGLDQRAAEALGLPPLVDLVFRTDVEGSLGTSSFRLRHEWLKLGRRQAPRRIGAILETSDGPRRLPAWLLEAVEVAEAFVPGSDEAAHWEALARFRQALDPGIRISARDRAARVSITDFLQGLEVRLADRFSISPGRNARGEEDFEIVPFSEQALAARSDGETGISEAEGELGGAQLGRFQRRVRTSGALAAYRVGDGSYLVVDRGARPVLEVMSRMQNAPHAERAAFMRNPVPQITEAVEKALREAGKLEGLSPAGEEEMIEAAVGPCLVETEEYGAYSARVTGKTAYVPPAQSVSESQTTWLPEHFPDPLIRKMRGMSPEALDATCEGIREAIAEGRETVDLDGHTLPADEDTLNAVKLQADANRAAAEQPPVDQAEAAEALAASEEAAPDRGPPIVVATRDNFEELGWRPERGPRTALIAPTEPEGIRSTLKAHQSEALAWQIAAWRAGLPGVLNADEQGLGKTLQTIAFLRWLKSHMARPEAEMRGPVLVVAPTSLLENWEAEVALHLEEPGLGHLMRLYGSALGGFKKTGARGFDTQSGEERLDFSLLHEAIAEGRAHRFWILTTYTTLANYQHSLARIPFSAVVFDEIQALKNPASLRAVAARAVNADFRIGLTGTPIENSAVDLWAIMDQLCPGALDTLAEFRGRYGTPSADNMEELHGRVFRAQADLPPLALRRLKETVARDLPSKTRRLHPRLMPLAQAAAYEGARDKLAEGARGSALKMLHHIRTVSVHPDLDAELSDDDFIATSARLRASFAILDGIRQRRERALVFIEHRRMQYRFAELARQRYGLNRIDIINGDTPIRDRQAIVRHFQRHLVEDSGFDLLVLGPKAAGTGLTLTAATHVIHLSRWWNPAVEEQCNDRIHRIGQTQPVTIHVPMAIHQSRRENSFDCLLHSLMTRKRRLASSALWPMGDTREDAAALQNGLSSGQASTEGDPIVASISAMFARDGSPPPDFASDGSVVFD
ncbi:DEAD/DEAH box helicase [Paralimibaculum aggregatum]|uniref:DEAD/DEAH box helicase n=2 Tax=Paralimibaculum aggregatum TaxID=3036245 RepID=A0ABQ6LQX3_9RHOB|nr:DEAD/DEAH box helicase [Limibaculum sp. NKW23]